MNKKDVLITVTMAALISFVFFGVMGGLLYLFPPRAPETLTVSTTTTSVVVSTQTLTNRIPEYTYASIQVIDDDGNPISGAQVSITYSTWIGPDTNASGLATVKSRPEPSIQVYKKGYGTMIVSPNSQTVVLRKGESSTRTSYQSILSEIFKVGSKWTYTAVSDTEYRNLRYVDDYYSIFVNRAVFDKLNYLISLIGVDVRVPANDYTDGITLFSPQIDIVMRP